MKDIKEIAKAGLELAAEKRYERVLNEKNLSYSSWINMLEAELPHFDVSVNNASSEEGDVSESDLTNVQYVAKFNNCSFRIVPMSICAPGFNVKVFLEDIIVFTNGRLSEIAIPLIGEYFEKYPKCAVVYGDEDLVDEYHDRKEPYFKPAFSPNEFLEHFYFCNIVAVRRTAFRELDFLGEYGGTASLYHNLLRYIFKDIETVNYGVGHIPEILLHARDYDNAQLIDAGISRIVAKFDKRKNVPRKQISPVICSKDHPDMLAECLKFLYEAAKAANMDLDTIVVDNGSTEDNKAAVYKLQKVYGFKYLYSIEDFNFSHMCNLGAKEASSDMLLILNDDVYISDPHALIRMYAEAAYEFTGAAGIKLLYPEGSLIQHAGIVNTPFGPVHKLCGMTDEKEYYCKYNRLTKNCMAVTGACIMMRRENFDAVCGFEEELSVAYNDVDICFKLLERGLYIVCCNDVSAVHMESVTRGADDSEKKAARLQKEKDLLYKRHQKIGRQDFFISDKLLKEALDARIVPANQFNSRFMLERVETVNPANLSGAREDACLRVEIEYAGEYKHFADNKEEGLYIQGFSLITGSNNACYSKGLLLKGNINTYEIPFVGCQRRDVEEAYLHEKCVGLAGISLLIGDTLLPPDEYSIGVFVKRELSKERIYNYSDRILVVRERG